MSRDEHLDIGKKMMTDGDGLATLKVGVAGDGSFGVFFRLAEESLLQGYR